MICNDCIRAGEYNKRGHYVLAETTHQYCDKECGCQHKVGPEYVARAKVRPMQVQSP